MTLNDSRDTRIISTTGMVDMRIWGSWAGRGQARMWEGEERVVLGAGNRPRLPALVLSHPRYVTGGITGYTNMIVQAY